MNTDPDIIAEAREFVLDSMDNASPDLTRIVLSQINKASREATVQNFNTGGSTASTGVIRDESGNFIPAPIVREPQFDSNPNESTTVTDLTSGIKYDTSTGLPVIEINEYETEQDRVEREARQGANFNLNALSNKAFAELAGQTLLGERFSPVKEVTGINVPNVPTSPLDLAFLAFNKIDENQTRNIFDKKSKEDKIDILSQVVSKYSPENRQDAEFARSTPQPVSPSKTTSTRDDKLPGPREPRQFYESLEEARSGVIGPTEVGNRFNASKAMQDRELQYMEQVPPATIGEQIAKALEPVIDNIVSSKAMEAREQQYMDQVQQADKAAKDIALDTDVGPTAGIDVGTPDVDVSAPDVSAPDAPDSHGGLNKGGPVNMQVGGEVDNADTNMEVANVPMGVVGDMDGAPAPFNGGTGVEDDLDMEVEAGSYILNAEAVQLIGVSDINKVIRDAYSIAAALGNQMPQDYDQEH